MKIAIEKIIVSKDNPRQSFDEEGLRRLGESIKTHGQLQAIVVRPRGSSYELVVGERRLRASVLVGLSEIEADVRIVDDVSAMELRLIENTQREDLSDADKGDAVLGLWANYEKYATLKDVADSIGANIKTVQGWTDKARKLSDEVKELLRAQTLTDYQARYLPKYPKYLQNKFAKVIEAQNLTGRQTLDLTLLYDKEPSEDLYILSNKVKGIQTVTLPKTEVPKKILEQYDDKREEQRQIAKIQRIPRKRSELLTKDKVRKELAKKADFKFEKVKVTHGIKGLLPPLKQEVKATILPNPHDPDYALCKCALCPLFAVHCKGRCWT